MRRTRLPGLPRLAPATRAQVRPFGIASAVAAGWAAVMGLIVVGVPVLLVWASAAHTQSSGRDATVVSADVWLAAHHIGFFVDGHRMALLPLGLLVVPFLLLRLSGGWAARVLRPATLADAALLTAATAAVYGLIAGLVAVVAGNDALHANPFEALVWAGLVAFVSVGWTTVRVAGLGDDVLALVPAQARGLLRPALLGVATLLAGAAVLTIGSLVVHGGDALALVRALDGGLLGGVAIALLSLAYLPNLVVWFAAFCVGPGFAVGTGTGVTLAGVSSGPLPAFPLFAAVPSSGVPPAAAWLCLLVPVVGGVAAGWSMVRTTEATTPETAALRAGMAGAIAGTALGVLAWLAGGPLGAGRLAVMGPSPWQVGLLAAVELGVAAAVTAWALGWRADARRRAAA